MSKPNDNGNSNKALPPIIHYASGTAPAEVDDSTMLLASVSEQYGSSIPSTRFAKKRETVDTTTAKHGQLPMFLTKTYHMIDQTESGIVSWSEKGDSFVIKDQDKFSSEILPQYFKHSNFASFARQLNFYGFRKLKNEPILTNDYDAMKASYISFFHEKFQRGKPDLLTEIKRATKADHSAKTESDLLKEEITSLRDQLQRTVQWYNTKLERVVADSNQKFNEIWTALKPLLPNGVPTPMMNTNFTPMNTTGVPPLIHNSNTMQMMPNNTPTANVPGMFYQEYHHMQPAASTTVPPRMTPTHPPPGNGYSMQSLSHVAGAKLQSPSMQPQLSTAQPAPIALADQGVKRSAVDSTVSDAKKSKMDQVDTV